jgi:hypothetical protein
MIISSYKQTPLKLLIENEDRREVGALSQPFRALLLATPNEELRTIIEHTRAEAQRKCDFWEEIETT